jgi:pSer/pThr/pTyr-binding forkhead associated (FHA) protein
MNVISDTASGTGEVPEPGPTGELVVQNGRMKGIRRPLVTPLTLIGQAQGCEVRLNVDGVQPLHCAIAHSPQGYVLRDLSTDRSAQLNGHRVSIQPLQDGDLLSVGPFEFLVVIPEPMRSESLRRAAGNLKAERDALRIQAAAVASQQAGLTEEEIRLEQRCGALQRQEEQLSTRLDERQRQLRMEDDQLRQERAAFARECAAEEQRQVRERAELARDRTEQEKTRCQLAAQRGRLVELCKRLKRRWQKQWSVQQAEMDRREKARTASQAQLVKASAHLEREQQKLTEARLRFNGEMELGRRQLHEEWQELGLAQQQWEATLNEEHAERQRRLRALGEREQTVARAAGQLQKEQAVWNRQRTVLAMDIDGLESRVRNQRQKLQEVTRTEDQGASQEINQGSPPIPNLSISEKESVQPPDSPPMLLLEGIEFSERVKQIAGLVADQRWHLVEQWERLLRVQDDWERERTVGLAELEEATQRLQQREQRLDERAEQMRKLEAVLEGRVTQMQQRQESLSQLRCALEGSQAKLQVQVTSWEAEREEVLSSVRAREETLATQLFRAEELHRKRTERLKQHVQALRTERKRCEEVRKQYVALWKAARVHHKALLTEQQTAARQTVALETFRMECLAQAEDMVTAEKRLERLQRNGEALHAEADQQLELQWQTLQAEMDRQDNRARLLAETEEDLVQRTDALAAQLSDLENQQAAVTQAASRRQQEVESYQVRYQLAEQQIQNLRDEVERLAQMLLEEVDAGLPPAASSQAA